MKELWGVKIVLGLVLVTLTVFIVDCAQGHWVYYHGTITNHRYVPSETTSRVDSDGHTSFSTSPEEYHLGFLRDDGGSLDISTTQSGYNSVADNEHAWVRARKGRFGIYLAHITDPPAPEK